VTPAEQNSLWPAHTEHLLQYKSWDSVNYIPLISCLHTIPCTSCGIVDGLCQIRPHTMTECQHMYIPILTLQHTTKKLENPLLQTQAG